MSIDDLEELKKRYRALMIRIVTHHRPESGAAVAQMVLRSRLEKQLRELGLSRQEIDELGRAALSEAGTQIDKLRRAALSEAETLIAARPLIPSQSRNVWIIATLRPTSRGFDLYLEDERRVRVTPRAGDKRRKWRTLTGAETVRVPARTRRFVQDAFVRHQAGPGPSHLTAKIPVFVQPPPERLWDAWELDFEWVVPRIVQPVGLAHRTWTYRPPFNLPIDVLAVGRAREFLHNLELASWYRGKPEVRKHGLVIENTDRQGLAAALQVRGRDVVVAMESDWPRVLSTVRDVPIAASVATKNATERPRLIILIVHSTTDLPVELLGGVPEGTALLLVQRFQSSVSRTLREFFFGMFHDLPLHGALGQLPRHPGGPSARLIADPASNQSIRISEALAHVQDLTRRLRHGVSVGDVEAFIARSRKATRDWRDIATALRTAHRSSAPIGKAIDLSDQLAVDFTRESRGLVPMAEALAGLWNANRLVGHMQGQLAKITSRPTLLRELEQAQQRYVDVALEEHDAAVNAILTVDRRWSLRTNSDYRLRVHIGHRSKGSLIVGDPPPIDPLLPELPEGEPGYELDVVVFEKDFELRSVRLLHLFLPRLGGSQPVYFQIRTPRSARKKAELRINIYYRNHLVQAFLLKAPVGRQPRFNVDPVVTVELDVATSASFGNLAQLSKRAIAIGVNADASGQTHSIMIKKEGYASHPIQLTEALTGNQIEKFRKLLKRHTEDKQEKPYFVTHPAAGAAPVPQFDVAIRDLAGFGRKLYDGVFDRVLQEMEPDLSELRGQSDLVIQVIRHEANGVLPWPVVYDYFPPSAAHRHTAPVCRGAPIPNAPPSVRDGLQDVRGCPHNPGREVYCIDGFWGFRHRIEQLTSGGGATNSVTKLDTASVAHAVCLANGITQRYGTDLAKALDTAWGKKFLPFPPPTPPPVIFGEFMWDAHHRPAVLVLLSHLESSNGDDDDDDGNEVQISLVPSASPALTITANQISQLASAKKVWNEEPHTLILLMACESAATNVGTLNSFVHAFKAAGASAIVGTEVPVYSSLAARFAEDLIAALRGRDSKGDPVSLGRAMRHVALRLLGEGNPLGLVFTYCGSSDLVLL